MDNLIPIAVSFTAGLLMRRFSRMPERTLVVLNAFIICLSLPAMVLYSICTASISARRCSSARFDAVVDFRLVGVVLYVC